MGKDNLFLGFGRGKLGDIVFSRTNGEQVFRTRNRSPKNPRTILQLSQRVIMKTVSLGYSMLQDICNHSFQGLQEGTPNQSRFARLNVAKIRAQITAEHPDWQEEDLLNSALTNFNYKSMSLAVWRAFQVSEGTLPNQHVVFDNSVFQLQFPVAQTGLTAATLTYQQVVDGLGLERGDQLTFLLLSIDDREDLELEHSVFNSFLYARVILEPDDGDMSSLFFGDGGAINKPNGRNEGNLTLTFTPAASTAPDYFTPSVEGISSDAGKINSLAAVAVIASRQSGGIWQRSTQSLVLRPTTSSISGHLTWDHDIAYLGDAIQSYMTARNSSLYLNQANF